jgi:hypothetical protein
VRRNVAVLEPTDQAFNLLRIGVFLQHDYHLVFLISGLDFLMILFLEKQKRPRSFPERGRIYLHSGCYTIQAHAKPLRLLKPK